MFTHCGITEFNCDITEFNYDITEFNADFTSCLDSNEPEMAVRHIGDGGRDRLLALQYGILGGQGPLTASVCWHRRVHSYKEGSDSWELLCTRDRPTHVV